MARFDAPPFDNSAMDGYAVRAADVASAAADTPVRLPVRGESRAGGTAPRASEAGHRMSDLHRRLRCQGGADAVVMQEDTDTDGDEVAIRESSHEGKHVRARGHRRIVRCVAASRR